MKHTYFLLSVLVLSLSSCMITIESSSSGFTDEIYYSEAEYAEQAAQDALVVQQYEEDYQEEYVEEEYEEVEYTDEFDYDNCYDYYYTARLRRFHGSHYGFSYYNNYYTNSFWYSSNPYHCGMSIYYGYNFWDPWYNDPWNNHHFGYGYYPYNHHGWGHHSYHYGYNDGYYAGGYYPTYFNSYDNNSIYHGPRENNNRRTPEHFANRYVTEVKQNPNRWPQAVEEEERPTYSGNRTPAFESAPASTRQPSSQNNDYNRGRVNTNVNNQQWNKTPSTTTRPSSSNSTNKVRQPKPSSNKSAKPNRTSAPQRNNNVQQSSPKTNTNYRSSAPSRSSSPSRSTNGSSNKFRSPR